MNTALQDANSRLEGILQQMSNGLRVQKPSDDPIASVRIARLTREEAALDQYLENIGALRSRLRQNEELLDGMSRDIMQARDLMVWAADGCTRRTASTRRGATCFRVRQPPPHRSPSMARRLPVRATASPATPIRSAWWSATA
jgi:flagellar hook-associated protein 3 FlgL